VAHFRHPQVARRSYSPTVRACACNRIHETFEETRYPCRLLPLDMITRAPAATAQTKDAPEIVNACEEPFILTLHRTTGLRAINNNGNGNGSDTGSLVLTSFCIIIACVERTNPSQMKCQMSVKGTAGTTPAPSKVGHIHRESSSISPHFCIRWHIHVAELCSLVSPIARKCIITMHPMDTQSYDLSKRCSVSL
jgi:hypothetical protein